MGLWHDPVDRAEMAEAEVDKLELLVVALITGTISVTIDRIDGEEKWGYCVLKDGGHKIEQWGFNTSLEAGLAALEV